MMLQARGVILYCDKSFSSEVYNRSLQYVNFSSRWKMAFSSYNLQLFAFCTERVSASWSAISLCTYHGPRWCRQQQRSHVGITGYPSVRPLGQLCCPLNTASSRCGKGFQPVPWPVSPVHSRSNTHASRISIFG